ncbi:MAG: TIGR03086 family protein [Nocardioidaceae bacterium]|nr:TIGR03086 family protein [Nocardioidaceae bacterium]
MDEIRVLSHALDQTGDLLAQVHVDQLSLPTPCADWTVAELAAHLVAAPGRFLQMLNGEQPDWSATPAPIQDRAAETFRNAADDLIHAWHRQPAEAAAGADWQTAEFAVHTWDLATAIGRSTDSLDPEVAERGAAFMRANLTEENRDPVFGPEQDAPEDADPYTRLAAFAGRSVGRE